MITHAEGRAVALSATELRLLGLLLRHAQVVISRLRLKIEADPPCCAPPGATATC